MPCNMYDGATAGDFANNTANDALLRIKAVEQRQARIEEALCGLCQTLESENFGLHPQLRMWFEYHKQLPGCELNGK